MTRIAALCILVALTGPASANSFYETRLIVTGTGPVTRAPALRDALARILVKASGNPALRNHPRLASIDPAPLVAAFAYLDRMSDIPLHDEQGTRDRPFDLIVRFDASRVNALLRDLGAAPWSSPRPALALDVEITPRRGDAMPMRADTTADERHRSAMLAAAGEAGLDTWLPAAKGGVPAPADAVTLHGDLRWSDQAAGWVSEWRLAWHGHQNAWGASGTSFDDAYRAGLEGAARILSGSPDR